MPTLTKRSKSILIGLLAVAILLAGFAWWARGRGYMTTALRMLHLRNPTANVARTTVNRRTRSKPLSASAPAIPIDPALRFEKVVLANTNGICFTSLVIGPDHLLYAGADDGRIFRYPILPNGTLGTPEIFSSIPTANGGPRLLSGFCFDPKSTPDEPIIWASLSYFGFANVPDWTGKIVRVSGHKLDVVQDVIINLPRSFKDHTTFQPVFGPDGAIYFGQGSNSAYGAPDAEWGNRPERLLSATILRVDPTKLPTQLPIDAKTPDGGGSYNPFAPDAPLTIYAFGLRVAFDLLWASDGNLYAPTNGSSAGGNTPSQSISDGLALTNLPIDEDDWLFKVTPGKYYGHPNPQQGHYVLNGGNPTKAVDFAEISQYPVGTAPDSDWVPAIYNFGVHISADGVIEYHGEACEGKLDGKIMVCRYNVGSDIICLGLDANGNVTSAVSGIPGLSGFINPLDLIEDVQTGYIYVAEYGAQHITLARPLMHLTVNAP